MFNIYSVRIHEGWLENLFLESLSMKSLIPAPMMHFKLHSFGLDPWPLSCSDSWTLVYSFDEVVKSHWSWKRLLYLNSSAMTITDHNLVKRKMIDWLLLILKRTCLLQPIYIFNQPAHFHLYTYCNLMRHTLTCCRRLTSFVKEFCFESACCVTRCQNPTFGVI